MADYNMTQTPPTEGKPVTISEKEAKTLKERLCIAERYAKKTFGDKWCRAEQLYAGDHFTNQQSAYRAGAVVVNYTQHIVDTKVASIAFRYPDFTVLALTSNSEPNVELAHSAVKYEWKTARIQREARRALKDKEIYGTGLVYNNWLFETNDEMRMEDGRHPVEGQEIDETPDPSGEEREMVAVQDVREDRFLCKRINPKHFLVDPECGRVLDEAEYCGYWELRPLTEVKKNPHWKNTKSIKGNTHNLRGYFSDDYLKYEDDRPYELHDVKRVKLYHYYERRRRLHVIFCEEHNKPLYVGKWNWSTDQYPFRYLQAAGDEDTFYGMPPPLAYEGPQIELDEARSQLRRFRRQCVPQFWTRTGNLSRQAREQVKSAIPLGIVETNGEPVNQIPTHQIQQEVYQTEPRAIQDMQTLAALDQYQLGRAPSKRVTTQEVEAIQSSGGARAQDDRQVFEQFCSDIATDCLQFLQQYSVKARDLPVYDMEGNLKQFWPDFTREEIKGQFHIEVYVGSTSAPNNADVLEGMAFLIQSLPPFLKMVIEAGQMGLDLSPMLKDILKSVPGIRSVDRLLQNFNVQQLMQMQQPPAPAGVQPDAPPGSEPIPELPPPILGEEGTPQLGAGVEQLPPEFLQAILAANR